MYYIFIKYKNDRYDERKNIVCCEKLSKGQMWKVLQLPAPVQYFINLLLEWCKYNATLNKNYKQIFTRSVFVFAKLKMMV